MPLESFFAATSDEEDWCERAWLDWRESLGLGQLTLLERPASGPDRLYVTTDQAVVAVEMTRLLEKDQREAEAFAEAFLRTRVLPQTQGKMPGSFAVGIEPPWRVSKGQAANVAARLIDWIVRSAATMRPGDSLHLTFDDHYGQVDMSLDALGSADPGIWLGSLGGGGCWDHDDYYAPKLAGVIRSKIKRGQLSRVNSDQRVLLVHDRLYIPDSAVDAAAALLSVDEMKELNEVIFVRTWEGTSCVRIWPIPVES